MSASPVTAPIKPETLRESFIALPHWIAVSKLSLAEIGALACFLSGDTHAGGNPAALERRLRSRDVRNALVGLRAKGVFTSVKTPEGICLSFNLDAVAPK